jgi:hypothetical protein
MEATLTKLRAILQRVDGFRGFSTRWVMGDGDIGSEFGVSVCNWFRKVGLMLGTASTAVAEDRKVFRDRFGIGSGG